MMSFQRIEPIEKSGTGNTVKLDQITCQMLVYHDTLDTAQRIFGHHFPQLATSPYIRHIFFMDGMKIGTLHPAGFEFRFDKTNRKFLVNIPDKTFGMRNLMF